MNITGSARKLITQLNTDNTVKYVLKLDNQEIVLNNLLNKNIKIEFLREITCIFCKKKTKKSYRQGYCFLCSKKLAQCDFCILKPSKCHFSKGTCREPKWGEEHCFIPHIIYLANSSGIKIGITRETQIPTRWIDQGAIQALPIIRVQSRYQSGLIEEEFSKQISDKTNWRKMLQNKVESINLINKRDELLYIIKDQIQKISEQFTFGDIEILFNEKITEIKYPVLKYPEKIISFNIDRENSISGILTGIKGQYLILNSGVLNIRKITGYSIGISY